MVANIYVKEFLQRFKNYALRLAWMSGDGNVGVLLHQCRRSHIISKVEARSHYCGKKQGMIQICLKST